MSPILNKNKLIMEKNGVSCSHFYAQMDLVVDLLTGYRLCTFEEINSVAMYSRLFVLSNSIRLLANEICSANNFNGGLFDNKI